MDIRAQAPARTSPPGGLEALIPRQRPKDTPAGTLPLVFLRLSASGPHGPEGDAGSASAGVEAKLAAEERLEHRAAS